VSYALSLIRQWLAYQLKGTGTTLPYEVYFAVTRPRDEGFNPDNVFGLASYAELTNRSVEATFTDVQAIANPVGDPYSGFVWDPLVMEGARELKPYTLPELPQPVGNRAAAVYETPASQLNGGAPVIVAGQPTVTIQALVAGVRVQYNVRLFDVAPGGAKSLITRGTYTYESGSSLPAENVTLTIPTYGNLWRIPADHTVRLEITNLDSPYISPSKLVSETTITGVTLTIPVCTAARALCAT
jgi:hypothetical protein